LFGVVCCAVLSRGGINKRSDSPQFSSIAATYTLKSKTTRPAQVLARQFDASIQKFDRHGEAKKVTPNRPNLAAKQETLIICHDK
jgi:hypothetical protein